MTSVDPGSREAGAQWNRALHAVLTACGHVGRVPRISTPPTRSDLQNCALLITARYISPHRMTILPCEVWSDIMRHTGPNTHALIGTQCADVGSALHWLRATDIAHDRCTRVVIDIPLTATLKVLNTALRTAPRVHPRGRTLTRTQRRPARIVSSTVKSQRPGVAMIVILFSPFYPTQDDPP
jgi:hypothetical protein